jgi:mono/diheme cytochrome c family protein
MRGAIAITAMALSTAVAADDVAPPPQPQKMMPEPEPEAPAPVPPEVRIAQGKNLYRSYCTRCHGLNMVSVGSAFFDLRTFPHDDKPRFVNSVTNGKRAMPAWGGTLSAAEIDLLWAYVSSYKQ